MKKLLLATALGITLGVANTRALAQTTGVSPPASGGASITGSPNQYDVLCGGSTPSTQITNCGGSNHIALDKVAGAPTRTDLPAGSLETDYTDGIPYIYDGTQTAPAIVQVATPSNTSYNSVFGSTPTPGNYMIEACMSDAGVPATAGGWVQFGSKTPVNGSFNYNFIQRKVQSGDGTSQTGCSGGSGDRGNYMVEVSGLSSSSFTSNLQALTFLDAAGGTATNNYTTTTANTLNLCFAAGFVNSGNATISGSTWSGTQFTNNNQRSVGGGYNVASANATAISCQSNGNSGMGNGIVTLQPNNTQTTGHQPISLFTTLKSLGSNLNINTRTANFLVGIIATDDGAGNSSIGLAGGSQPTIGGTCTTGSKTGGTYSGSFTATCTAQTVILSAMPAAPNGYTCSFHDLTTPTDTINQSATSTTGCTGTGTTVASDVVTWEARPY